MAGIDWEGQDKENAGDGFEGEEGILKEKWEREMKEITE